MAIPAMALLQQHDARWDILIERAAWWRAAIEARGHSELGAQSGRKNLPACNIICQLMFWTDSQDTYAMSSQQTSYNLLNNSSKF